MLSQKIACLSAEAQRKKHSLSLVKHHYHKTHCSRQVVSRDSPILDNASEASRKRSKPEKLIGHEVSEGNRSLSLYHISVETSGVGETRILIKIKVSPVFTFNLCLLVSFSIQMAESTRSPAGTSA